MVSIHGKLMKNRINLIILYWAIFTGNDQMESVVSMNYLNPTFKISKLLKIYVEGKKKE